MSVPLLTGLLLVGVTDLHVHVHVVTYARETCTVQLSSWGCALLPKTTTHRDLHEDKILYSNPCNCLCPITVNYMYSYTVSILFYFCTCMYGTYINNCATRKHVCAPVRVGCVTVGFCTSHTKTSMAHTKKPATQ